MNRSIIIYAALLLGASGWAYQTWTHQDELQLEDKVVILPGKPEQLSSVVFLSEQLELTIEQREDDRGRYAWGHTVPKADPEPDDEPEPDGEDEGGEAKPPKPPPPEPEQFKMGQAGEKLLGDLAPFVAKRRLEGAGEDLEALGLAEPTATLQITREGKEPRTFELGSSVFGGANVYVRDAADGAIYLVDSKLTRTLDAATRTLPDRRLTGIDERKAERVTVRVGDRQASFEQHNPDDVEARFWSPVGEEDEAPAATAWVGKVMGLRSTRYVQEGETPVDLAHAFDVRVQGQDDSVVTVEVLRNFDEEGAEQFFARSEHTRGLVRLPRASVSEASANLESVLQAGGA